MPWKMMEKGGNLSTHAFTMVRKKTDGKKRKKEKKQGNEGEKNIAKISRNQKRRA